MSTKRIAVTAAAGLAIVLVMNRDRPVISPPMWPRITTLTGFNGELAALAARNEALDVERERLRQEIDLSTELAQRLIASAWSEGRATGNAPRPWPWADLKPVGRLRVAARGIDLYVLDNASLRSLAFGPALVRTIAVALQLGLQDAQWRRHRRLLGLAHRRREHEQHGQQGKDTRLPGHRINQ